jgi:hypothetical protein
MMNKRISGGSAFPHPDYYDRDDPEFGMSLLDWFAGLALAGLLAGRHPLTLQRFDDEVDEIEKPLTAAAYQLAEAMVLEKERGARERSEVSEKDR